MYNALRRFPSILCRGRRRSHLGEAAPAWGIILIAAINARIMPGAWGGGNQFVRCLTEYLASRGHQVLHDLDHPRIDVIVMIHPDPRLKIITAGIDDIRLYLRNHPQTRLLHRVNTNDDRKGGTTEVQATLDANRSAHHTVFISEYLRDHYMARGFPAGAPHSVIRNGADERLFSPQGRAPWAAGQPLRTVTHHWSNNRLKGFDIYEQLDVLLGKPPFSEWFQFTLIGNVPPGSRYANTTVIPPLFGAALAEELRRHHLYVTGSRNEPAGMHQIEGMACGLPVLYVNSGALPEYCRGFGLRFEPAEFEAKLLEMRQAYAGYREAVLAFQCGATAMARHYEDLLTALTDAVTGTER
jgi:glycosyltransferase involved in cell wall biosynthesis